MSELIKKEQFYKCYRAFEQAVLMEPAIIKEEIVGRMRGYDQVYGLRKHEEDRKRGERFTQGDFRRFCALFFLITRRLLKKTEFLMQNEGKKRV